MNKVIQKHAKSFTFIQVIFVLMGMSVLFLKEPQNIFSQQPREAVAHMDVTKKDLSGTTHHQKSSIAEQTLLGDFLHQTWAYLISFIPPIVLLMLICALPTKSNAAGQANPPTKKNRSHQYRPRPKAPLNHDNLLEKSSNLSDLIQYRQGLLTVTTSCLEDLENGSSSFYDTIKNELGDKSLIRAYAASLQNKTNESFSNEKTPFWDKTKIQKKVILLIETDNQLLDLAKRFSLKKTNGSSFSDENIQNLLTDETLMQQQVDLLNEIGQQIKGCLRDKNTQSLLKNKPVVQQQLDLLNKTEERLPDVEGKSPLKKTNNLSSGDGLLIQQMKASLNKTKQELKNQGKNLALIWLKWHLLNYKILIQQKQDLLRLIPQMQSLSKQKETSWLGELNKRDTISGYKPGSEKNKTNAVLGSSIKW